MWLNAAIGELSLNSDGFFGRKASCQITSKLMIFDVTWRKRTSQRREIGLANMPYFVIEGHGGQQGAVLSHSPQNVL